MGSTMRSWIDDSQETAENPSLAQLTQLIASGDPFWLDVENPTDEMLDLLADGLGLHPLAVEDSKLFGQRAKVQIYGDLAMMVGFGFDAVHRAAAEVHCYYAVGFLVTLRRVPIAALDDVRRTGSLRPLLGGDPIQALHHVISALHEPFPAFIDEQDERLSQLEQRVLQRPDDQVLTGIGAIRRRAGEIRRTLMPGRDLAARVVLVTTLPGATDNSMIYAADIADELDRIVADLRSIEERCLSVLGLHESLASNRQEAVARRLTRVATIFLPITFLVGFFGQNFSVLVDPLEQGWVSFAIFCVLLNVACVTVTVIWLGRRGWH